jgi:hypothetical protein
MEGRQSFFSWTWGLGLVPSGFTRATEHYLLRLRNGRVLWWRDDLTPPPCTAPGFCSRIPVELVGEHSGTFFAFGSDRSHTCYGHLNGSTPYRVGGAFDTVAGRFDAPARRGGTIRLTYSYPWFGVARQIATETDTLSARSLLNHSGLVHVARGPGASRPAFTFRFSDSYPARAQPAPSINLCRG